MAWTYDHRRDLAAPPVVARDGVVLLDEGGQLLAVDGNGALLWDLQLDATPGRAFNSPAVWRRGGRTLVSVSHDAGVQFVEPGIGTVRNVTVGDSSRFLSMRDDGLVFWGPEEFSLRDWEGTLLEEVGFSWRTDDVAHPVVGPDGGTYFLSNREYSISWDTEDQFLEVERATFRGGAKRATVFSAHAGTTDALGSLCATDAALFWVLDGWRIGALRFDDGQASPVEADIDTFPTGGIPSWILCGKGDTVLLQRPGSDQSVYELSADGTVTVWPVDEPILATTVDGDGFAYMLTDGAIRCLDPAGDVQWTTNTDGRWLALGGDGRLLATARDGVVTCLR